MPVHDKLMRECDAEPAAKRQALAAVVTARSEPRSAYLEWRDRKLEENTNFEVRWDPDKGCWMWSAARQVDSKANKSRNLNVALRYEFQRQERFKKIFSGKSVVVIVILVVTV